MAFCYKLLGSRRLWQLGTNCRVKRPMTFRYKGQEVYDIHVQIEVSRRVKVQTKGSRGLWHSGTNWRVKRPMTSGYKLKACDIQVQTEGPVTSRSKLKDLPHSGTNWRTCDIQVQTEGPVTFRYKLKDLWHSGTNWRPVTFRYKLKDLWHSGTKSRMKSY